MRWERQNERNNALFVPGVPLIRRRLQGKQLPWLPSVFSLTLVPIHNSYGKVMLG